MAVSVSGSRTGPFGPFQLVHFQGHRSSAHGDLDIYFGSVNANPLDGGHSLVGLFPVRTRRAAFIAIAVSCDGVHFSRMLKVIDSEPSSLLGRGIDHPVDGLVRRGGTVYFYVHHNVPGIPRMPNSRRQDHRSKIVRYSMDARQIMELTGHCLRLRVRAPDRENRTGGSR